MGMGQFISGRDMFSMKSRGTGSCAEKYRTKQADANAKLCMNLITQCGLRWEREVEKGTRDESSKKHPCNIWRSAVGEGLREGSVWSSNSRSDCRSIVSCTTGTLSYPSACLISSGRTTRLSLSVTLRPRRVNVCESDTQRYKVFMSCQVVVLQSHTFRHEVPLQCVWLYEV